MTVTQFAVRTVDGIPALDGTLAAEGERLVLVTADGQRHPIAHPPDALRAHVGGRVWVSGNLAQGGRSSKDASASAAPFLAAPTGVGSAGIPARRACWPACAWAGR